MKIARSIGIAVAALVVIIVAALVYVLSSLDAIVAGTIEHFGSQVTQTPVQVSSVNIDLKAGSAAMEQLTVGNPDGFSAPNIFILGGISTKLDVASIGKDPIVIEEIRVDKPDVIYEINKVGASNIKELQKNIEQSSGGGGETAAESTESGGPKVVIRKLVIDGGKSGGATGAEVAQQVMHAIIARVGPAVANLGLDKYVGKSLDEAKALLNEKVGDQLGESLGDKAKEGTEGLKKLLGQ